jgi:glycosyltransferase involved in cell wall biosynthesis
MSREISRAARPPLLVDVIIPALDEEGALPRTLASIPRASVRDVYVVDNGSTDRTAIVAEESGATVLSEPRRGYGAACLRAVRHVTASERPPDVVVFLDADYSNDPTEIPWLVEPIRAGGADLVIGSRALGEVQPGAVGLAERVCNRAAIVMMRAVYAQRYSDVGRFRAIRLPALIALGMRDEGVGWPIEMQVKAARAGLRVVEVPVSYRRRAGGRSKISSTARGALGSSLKVVYHVVRYATAR